MKFGPLHLIFSFAIPDANPCITQSTIQHNTELYAMYVHAVYIHVFAVYSSQYTASGILLQSGHLNLRTLSR